jgi:hypothetical protein
MVLDRNGEHIIGAQDVAGFCDLCPVEADVARFDQFGSHSAVLHHTGEPKPLVQALRQFFLPII